MADRVHPEPPTPSPAAGKPLKPPPPPTSFVIQLPKDQIYRIPPPENEYRFNLYTRRTAHLRRNSRRRFLAFFLIPLSLLFISLTITIAILYLIFLPKLPVVAINSLSIRNINLWDTELTFRSENPNGKGEIWYRGGGAIDVSFAGEVLCRGAWPSFRQGRRNVTAVKTALEGSGIRLSDDLRGRLTAARDRRKIPLAVSGELPVRMRFGVVESWTFTVKLRCDVTVDELTANSTVGMESCRVKVDVF